MIKMTQEEVLAVTDRIASDLHRSAGNDNAKWHRSLSRELREINENIAGWSVNPSEDRMALRLLVAAGHISEDLAGQALSIARGITPGPLVRPIQSVSELVALIPEEREVPRANGKSAEITRRRAHRAEGWNECRREVERRISVSVGKGHIYSPCPECGLDPCVSHRVNEQGEFV